MFASKLRFGARAFCSAAGTTQSSVNKSSKVGNAAKLAAVVGAGGFAYSYANDEGLRRSCTFWSTVFPIFVHYRWVQWRMKGGTDEDSDAAFNALHDKYSPVVEQLTLKMRGFYLKNAQTLSTVDFFLPPQYLKWCKKMQSEVPSEIAPSQVREIIESSLGCKIEDVFSEFQEVPVGSASIGQVHKARLRSNGDVVAIKIQAPGVERRFRSDIKTTKMFCKLAMPQHVSAMDEIEKQFATEFDFVGEAHNLNEIYENIMPVYGDKVVIPRPYLDLCSKEVLVMEFLEGETLLKGVKKMFGEFAASQGKTLEEVEQEQKELIKSGLLKLSDVETEEAKMRRYQKLANATVTLENFGKGLYNYSLGWLLPNFEYSPYKRLLNLGEIMKLVVEVHGYEVMVNGAFNGDPHPGNILILPDGRLGLIDYGQVKHIPEDVRVGYAKTIIALAEGRKDDVVKLSRSQGYETKYQKEEIAYLASRFWNCNMSDEVTGGLNIQEFMDYIESEDPVIHIPQDYVMIGRVNILLRSIGNAFGINMKMSKMWKPIAESVLSEVELTE